MLSGDEIEIVGEASTGGEALRIAANLSPEVVLLDLELPDMDGLAVLRQIKELTPTLPVLVVTMHDDPALVRRAVRAGAAGYVLKSSWPACGPSGTGNQSSIPASCARSSMTMRRRRGRHHGSRASSWTSCASSPMG